MAKNISSPRLFIPPVALLLLGIALIICLVYWPGLHGPYVLDDGENLLLNPSVALTDLTRDNIYAALTGNDSGPLKRPIAALSFALNHYFNNGFYPSFAFKTTNLAIHLLNTCFIFLLSLKLLGTPRLSNRLDIHSRQRIAIFSAALWALHPIQLTNILYVVQRMNSLSALFMLAGLLLFTHGRMLLDKANTKGLAVMACGILGGSVLGLASKENAALLPLLALTIEYCFFGFGAKNGQHRRWLLLFYTLVIILPVVAISTYLVFNPDFILNTYLTRNFSVFERVLTETRVLWFYVGLIMLPASNRLGLFHDDIVLSTGLFTPVTTLFAVIGVLVALGLGLTQARRHPVVSFAILWFLAGNAIESSFLGLELAYEHRNYLPSYGILFAVTFGLVLTAKNRRYVGLIALAAAVLTLSFVTWSQANAWGNIENLVEQTVRNHPYSPRANNFAASTSLGVKHDMVAAIRYTLNGLQLVPEEAGQHIDLQILLCVLGVEIDHELQRSSKQAADRRFDVNVTGLDEKIRAIETKEGIRLFHDSSNPKLISRLLGTKPITVHGIFSLENLRHCILDPPRSCMLLRNVALTWFTIASRNPATTRNYRAILAGNTAMLYADIGDVERALTYMNQAVDLLPEHTAYRIGRAEYLIRLGRLDEARRVIDLITAGSPPTDSPISEYESNIRKLEELFNKASKKTESNKSPPE